MDNRIYRNFFIMLKSIHDNDSYKDRVSGKFFGRIKIISPEYVIAFLKPAQYEQK